MILAAVAGYCAVKAYSDENGRAPSLATAKGKEAQGVVGLIFIVLVALLVYNTLEVKPADGDMVTRVGSVLFGLAIPMLLYIGSRNKRNK